MITRFVTLLFAAALSLTLAGPARAIESCGGMLMPVMQLKQVSRGFSWYHSGVDLMAPYGSPLRAAAGGTVVFAGTYFGYGNMIDIALPDGTVTRYGHLSKFAPGLRTGAVLQTGDPIGAVGMSGHAHGPHLHFEVRVNGHAVDPKPFISLAVCTKGPASDPIEEARAPAPR